MKRFTVAWAWALPLGANESAPLVHDGVLFVQSANQVQALDAVTGLLLWKYVHDLPAKYQGSINQMHRSFAMYGENIYAALGDRHVVALAMKTGKVVWDHEVVPPTLTGVALTAGPTAANGKIIQGTTLGPFCKAGCEIVAMNDRSRAFEALDEENGESLWATRLDAAPNSSPMTYLANGKQYVAVVAGGGGLHDSKSVEVTPEIQNASPAATLWIFSLPK